VDLVGFWCLLGTAFHGQRNPNRNLEASIESDIGELRLIFDSQVYPYDRTQEKLIDLTANDSN
jgi:hypothetical protein